MRLHVSFVADVKMSKVLVILLWESMATTTIRDVAKQAGVGVGTVSRVINNHPSVSAATREVVESAIATMEFAPNLSARRLSSGKTFTIAAIVPFFTLPSFVERLQGVVAALEDTQYDVVIYNVETVERRDQYLKDVPRRKRFDGLLLVSLPLSAREAAFLAHSGLPTVLIDSNHSAFSRVVIDDVYGGLLATQHLISLGHEHIAYVSDELGSPLGFVAGKHRLEGYRQALSLANLPIQPEYHVGAVWHGVREARQAAEGLLRLSPRPTAIFASSDVQAIGVLQAAQDAGLRVPNDLSIIGYDDIYIAEYMHLTTIHQPLFTSGVEGVELLLDLIQQPDQAPREVSLEVRLVPRQTTAAPPI